MSGLGDGKDFSHRLCLLASDSPGFFTIMNNRLFRDKEGERKHSTIQPPPPSPLPHKQLLVAPSQLLSQLQFIFTRFYLNIKLIS